VPAEFEHMTGNITATQTVPQIRTFLEAGGAVITIGSSTALAEHLELPVHNHLTEIVDGELQDLPRTKYYVPGSVLEAQVDNTHPLAHGMGSTDCRRGQRGSRQGVSVRARNRVPCTAARHVQVPFQRDPLRRCIEPVIRVDATDVNSEEPRLRPGLPGAARGFRAGSDVPA
jgi:hypothetical protein